MAGPSEYIKSHQEIATSIGAFVGITWYIGIELNFRIFITFKRRRGLYFWGCLIGLWGSLLNQVFGAVLWDFGIVSSVWHAMPGIYLTWAMMIQGQSVVLYSRLHLVMHNKKHLRWVLAMIIVTAFGIGLPTVVIGLVRLDRPSLVMDRIQVTTFFIQEIVLSTLYIWKTNSYLKTRSILVRDDKRVHRVMRHLLYINLLIIFLDIVILVLSFVRGVFWVQAALKPAVYAMKLRLEFSILNRLVESVQESQRYSITSNRWSNQSLARTPWSQKIRYPQRPSLARVDSFSCRPYSDRLSQSPAIEGGFMDSETKHSMDTKMPDVIMQTTQISIAPSSNEAEKPA
jgi:hypothetical protein